MSISQLLLAIFFLLYGLNALAVLAVSATVLGIVALLLAVVLIVELAGVSTAVGRRNQ